MDTPLSSVRKFYEYWIRFESWRDFTGVDAEHKPDDAGSREEKRWMQKENAKIAVKKKQKESAAFWNDDTQMEKIIQSPDYYDFSEFDSLERFTETHPNVMLDRIERKNWVIDLDVSKKKLSFKKFVLYYFEKWTGIRPFDFKNYKIIRS
jgi:hypothetical protein